MWKAYAAITCFYVTGFLLTSTSEGAQKTKKLHGHMEGIHNTHTVGIPLPFVTHGGASLVSMAVGLGILQSINIRQNKAEW